MDTAADHHAAHGHHAADAPADKAAHDHGAAPHTCGTCGTCHAVALLGPPTWDAAQPLPPAHLNEPARPMATHVLRVLDRPPRA